jgi:hypothetical protein
MVWYDLFILNRCGQQRLRSPFHILQDIIIQKMNMLSSCSNLMSIFKIIIKYIKGFDFIFLIFFIIKYEILTRYYP